MAEFPTGRIHKPVHNYVWDVATLAWVVETQPGGGGGGGGGACTIADGADVTEGAIADAKVVGDTAGTVSAKLRGINTTLSAINARDAATIGSQPSSAAVTVHFPNDETQNINVTSHLSSGSDSVEIVSPFGDGVSSQPVLPVGGVVDDVAPGSAAEGTFGTFRVSPKRVTLAALTDDTGTRIATATANPGLSDKGLVTRDIPAVVTGTVAAFAGTGVALTLSNLDGLGSVEFYVDWPTATSVQGEFQVTVDGTHWEHVPAWGITQGEFDPTNIVGMFVLEGGPITGARLNISASDGTIFVYGRAHAGVSNYSIVRGTVGVYNKIDGIPLLVSLRDFDGHSQEIANTAPLPTDYGLYVRNNPDGTVTPISATDLPLPTGAATEATLAKLPIAPDTSASGQSGIMIEGLVSDTRESYISGRVQPLSLTSDGRLRVLVGDTAPPEGNFRDADSLFFSVPDVAPSNPALLELVNHPWGF